MKIALSGYYGFGNIGDEALLTIIKQKIAGAEFTVLDRSFKIISQIFRSDLLISGGGTLFQDKTSSRSFYYYIGVVALAKLMGKKVMILAQGFGPLNKTLNRHLARLVLNRVDIITLRDKQSLETIKKLGVTIPRIELTADPVF